MVHVLANAQLPCSFSSKWRVTNKALVPILCEGWGVGHKSSPIFSKTTMKYSQSKSRWVGRSKFLVWCNFSKLLKNISDILGHDVKLCDWNFPSSQYSTWIHMNSTSIYLAWYALEIPANFCILFEFNKVAFMNISTSFQYCSFMLIKVWL
jgi:hypothetical protein